MKKYADKFGRVWDLPKDNLCPKCGQPDVCGDCNHNKLDDREVIMLGGELSGKASKWNSGKKTTQTIKGWAIV